MSVFKSVRSILLVVFICAFVNYGYLKLSGISDLNIMVQTIFGGRPLGSLMLKSLFMIMLAFLQYVNVDFIVFFVDHAEHLVVRYGSRNKSLAALIKGVLTRTGLFIFLLFFILFLLESIMDFASAFSSLNINLVGTLATVYVFSILIVFVQILLLMKFSKTAAYVAISIASVVMAFGSVSPDFSNILLPGFDNLDETLMGILVQLFMVLCSIVLMIKINQRRELSAYED